MKIVFMTSGTINSSLSYRPLAFAKELVKKGHEVYIFAPRFDKYSKFKDEKITEIEGVKIVRPLQFKILSFELSLISYMFSSIFILFKLNPSFIHIYKPNPITITGLLLKFIKNTPVILDADDLDVEVMKVENISKFKIKLVEFSEKILTNQASAITAASIYLVKNYSTKYKNKLVTHIPNGAEFTNINRLSTSDIHHSKIIFVGNINRINILEPLLYASKKLKDRIRNLQVTIIGDGIYLNYFKKLAKELELNKTITFLGHIKRNQLNNHISIGDIGYCYMPNESTIKACSSMKVFQYMQFGAIPLVSNVGDLPMYIFHQKAGYIAKHNDINSLTEIIHKAFSNKKKNKEFINYAKLHAPQRFSWNALASDVENTYKYVIKN